MINIYYEYINYYHFTCICIYYIYSYIYTYIMCIHIGMYLFKYEQIIALISTCCYLG